MTSLLVYRLITKTDWSSALKLGYLNVDPQGFIHLSTAYQVKDTFQRKFKEQNGLLLITYDTATMGAKLKWENKFPHYYGQLPVGYSFGSPFVSVLPLINYTN
jgi:uncharacterized protein (DUF952 family)